LEEEKMKTNCPRLCTVFFTVVVLVLLFNSFAHADYIYVSCSGTIEKFDSGGNKSLFASGTTIPLGLAFDRSGNLYAATWYWGTIVKFDSSGNRFTFASGLNSPCGIAVIPEPASMAFLALGGLALLGRRKKETKNPKF
jgi:hypothetical protein